MSFIPSRGEEQCTQKDPDAQKRASYSKEYLYCFMSLPVLLKSFSVFLLRVYRWLQAEEGLELGLALSYIAVLTAVSEMWTVLPSPLCL